LQTTPIDEFDHLSNESFGESALNTKNLSCIDEELFVEVTTPLQDAASDGLIVTVSHTRIYLINDQVELNQHIQEASLADKNTGG